MHVKKEKTNSINLLQRSKRASNPSSIKHSRREIKQKAITKYFLNEEARFLFQGSPRGIAVDKVAMGQVFVLALEAFRQASLQKCSVFTFIRLSSTVYGRHNNALISVLYIFIWGGGGTERPWRIQLQLKIKTHLTNEFFMPAKPYATARGPLNGCDNP